MKTRRSHARAMRPPLADTGRRHLLQLGLALAACILGGRLPATPPQPGRWPSGGRLSRREAAFYSRQDSGR